MDEKFSKESFASADEASREGLRRELETLLSERLRGAEDFHTVAGELVSELRALGHDLWSVDESDDFEAWAPNYVSPTGPGLVITFTPEAADVAWSSS